MPLSSKTVRIVVLAGLSKFTSNLFKVGQMEAAKAWNRCRDAQQSAIEERTRWPHRDMLQKLARCYFSGMVPTWLAACLWGADQTW
jgi:hypothetical protein